MQKEGKKQLLVIEPKSEIAFKGPYDHVVTEYFTLKNPTDSPIAFKVKTTAPKKYCVRPNNGLVAPHQTVQVAVMLQPGDLSQEKHRHKFMIQSVIVQNNANQANPNVDELFKSVSPDEIMDSKFRCVFLDHGSAGGDATQGFEKVAQATHRSMLEEHPEPSGAAAADDAISTNNGTAEYSAADNHQTDLANGQCEEDPNNGAWSAASATATATTTGGLRNRKFNTSLKSDHGAPSATELGTGHTQEKKDLETELRLAQDEIRMLKDKLQQVQRYASKFAPPVASADAGDKSASSGSSAEGSTMLFNSHLTAIQLSAAVVVVSFIIGIFFGKTFV